MVEVNGKVLAESTAICKYLAKKFGLAGADDFEAAKCDEYVGSIMDCRTRIDFFSILDLECNLKRDSNLEFFKFMIFRLDWSNYFWETDEARKAELKKILLEREIPFYFSRFEKIISTSEGDFLLGKHYTWCDLHIAHTVTSLDETVKPGLLNEYPILKKFTEAVFNIPKVKFWIEKRPKTER